MVTLDEELRSFGFNSSLKPSRNYPQATKPYKDSQGEQLTAKDVVLLPIIPIIK